MVRKMKQLGSKLVLDYKPCPGNPRNSEGAFIRADDGTILFAYSRYTGATLVMDGGWTIW